MIPNSLISRDQLSVEEFSRNHTDVHPDLVVCVLYLHLKPNHVPIKPAINFCQELTFWELGFQFFSLVIGIPGNLMAAVTALSMDATVSSTYIFVLSVTDLFTLLARCATPTTNQVSFETFKRAIGFFPNAILVLICFERYMSVAYPWRRRLYFTLKAAYLSVALLVVLNITIAFICVKAALNDKLSRSGVNLVIATMLVGVPCPIIILLNALTIRKLKVMQMTQSRLWSQIEASITSMMIIASVVFFALNGPQVASCLYWYITDKIWDNKSMKMSETMIFTVNITYLLTMICHATNFYVYVLGTRRFRKQFISIISRIDKDEMKMSLTHSSASSSSCVTPRQENLTLTKFTSEETIVVMQEQDSV